MISLQERTVRLIRWHRGRSRTSIFAKCICWLFVAVVGLTLLAAHPARATVYTWSAGTSGNYSDPSNWTPSSPSPPPQSGDVAIFNQSGTYNVNGGGSTSIFSFESGTVTLNGAYSTDSKAFYSLYIGGGTLSMGANSSFAVNSLVAIGNNYDGSTAGGTLNVGTTSSVTIHDTSGFANITVGSALGGSGNVNVDGASALLNANGEMVVGYQSTGTVDILNGGLVQTDAVSASDSPGLAVGIDLGVQGTVLVDGMDPSMQHSSQLQNTGQITIGANGIGQLENAQRRISNCRRRSQQPSFGARSQCHRLRHSLRSQRRIDFFKRSVHCWSKWHRVGDDRNKRLGNDKFTGHQRRRRKSVVNAGPSG